jgi:hypothetical protein
LEEVVLVVLVQMVQMAVQEEALGEEDLEVVVVVVLDQLQVHQHFRWHY